LIDRQRPPADEDLTAVVRRPQAGQGSEADAERIFTEHYGLVWSFLHRESLRPQDCEDLIQEAFLRVFRNIGSYRGESSLKTWILVIARNLYRNEVRRPASSLHGGRDEGLERLEEVDPRELPSAALPGRQVEDDPFEAAWKNQQREVFLAAADELPEQMRRSVLLYYKGHEYRAIAALMGVEEPTVRAQVFQAKKRLAAKLGLPAPVERPERGRGGSGGT
jgi:RNA polymerase sigma-70 factor (ECF subfamily)